MLKPVRACVFDAYGTLLDIHSAVTRNAASIENVAGTLSALWRQRQLEYTWTRSLMKRYANFEEVTAQALDFAMRSLGLDGRTELRESLLKSYFELDAYPEAAQALEELRAIGVTVAVLSNGTRHMLESVLQASHLWKHLDACISVDEIQIYKPDPRVYQLACDRLAVASHEVYFVSSNAWDVAGAASFGFQAVWINRQGNAPEYGFAQPVSEQRSLTGVCSLVRESAV